VQNGPPRNAAIAGGSVEIQMMKQPGGLLLPAFDTEAERLEKFKTGFIYPVEIKQSRNPGFHGKAFSFLQFCFEHWSADKTDARFKTSAAQFDTFRKNLTVLAGYKDVTFTIDGRLRVDAKSLAFNNMDQAEFEECYSALINAALVHVFGGTTDRKILDKLTGFF
jgi:hypothetical protein